MAEHCLYQVYILAIGAMQLHSPIKHHT